MKGALGVVEKMLTNGQHLLDMENSFTSRNLQILYYQMFIKNEVARLEEQNEVFLNADKVESFKDLIEKLPEEFHRQRYILHRTENGAD